MIINFLIIIQGTMKKETISILSALTGAVVGAGAVAKAKEKSERKKQELSDKHLTLFLMMNRWVKVKQKGKNLALFFEKNRYKTIAIYGMSYVGETLLDELKDSEIKVVYGIDNNACAIYADVEIDVFSMDEELEDVDAIVVTAVTYFDEIIEQLEKKVSCPIISLEDVLSECEFFE